jgi:hypothetical protein
VRPDDAANRNTAVGLALHYQQGASTMPAKTKYLGSLLMARMGLHLKTHALYPATATHDGSGRSGVADASHASSQSVA